MANYEDNRVRCSRETALRLITSPTDGYRNRIDFRKALGLKPDDEIVWDFTSQWGPAYAELEDGRYDFGFSTRWHSDLTTLKAFITRYHDAEWWINQEYCDIYHYYWCDGEVIEDVHHITDEEQEILEELSEKYFDDEENIEHFVVLFTEKEDQSKYVNFHPDRQSAAYLDYLKLVKDIAQKIVNKGSFYALRQYDYNWEGAYQYYGTALSLREQYLHELNEDLSAYKLNIMSLDILEEIRQLKYPYNKKLYEAIWGLVIGDAMGVPYEFKERGSFTCKGFIGYGTHMQPAGTWSDDTAMTLATLKSLKDKHGKVDIEDIRKNFLLWYHQKAFTPDGILFDIGTTTEKALRTGQPCIKENENGNGSLMRILPLAFVECSDEEIRAVSGITHGHWIAKEACVIYVNIAKRLLRGEEIEGIIPTLKYDKPFDRLWRINELDISEIKSSGYVVDTLEAALWVVSRTIWANEEHTLCEVRDYERIIFDAINLGKDTDTVAAVAGGLAAIIHGLRIDCYKWIDSIRNKELVLDCLWDKP